jgi:ubiquinone/menaquinone biosynthesis C-methylase UbiE
MREILPRRFAEETVRDEYSRVAWLYDLWSTLTESKAARQVLEYADLRSGEHVLEIAVGTGKVFSEIVRQNTNLCINAGQG